MDNTANTNNPLVINNPIPNIAQNVPTSPQDLQNKTRKNLGKIIFGILALVIVIELFIGAKTLISPQNKSAGAAPDKIGAMSDASLALVPTSDSFKVGGQVPVVVKLATGGHSTDSTDIIIKYDPNYLEATGSSFIKLGNIYKDYPSAIVDKTTGQVAISGITPPKTDGFVGIGILATLYFVAKQEGKTQVTIDYQKGSTADSNVVKSGSADDILSTVYNTDIMIVSQNASLPSKQTPNTCSSYVQFCQTPDGKTGRQTCSPGKPQGNECKYDPQLTNSCTLCKIN